MTDGQVAPPSSPSMPEPPAVPEGWYARPDGTSAWWDGANWLTPVTPVVLPTLPAALDGGASAPRPVEEAERSATPIGHAELWAKPGDSAGGPAAEAKPRASRLAIASMVLGVAGLIVFPLGLIPPEMATLVPQWVVMLYFPLVTSAVVLGHVSRRRVDGRPGLETAPSMAGLIMGYIGLGLLLLLGLAARLSPLT
jgi:hypothetical protein